MAIKMVTFKKYVTNDKLTNCQ